MSRVEPDLQSLLDHEIQRGDKAREEVGVWKYRAESYRLEMYSFLSEVQELRKKVADRAEG